MAQNDNAMTDESCCMCCMLLYAEAPGYCDSHLVTVAVCSVCLTDGLGSEQ